MTITIPIRTVSEANRSRHEHWGTKSRRVKAQRQACYAATWNAIDYPQDLPCTVYLTRISPRKLDDDNLRGALKACRDGVADAIGVDDGDERVTWDYSQRRGKPKEYAVEVTVVHDADEAMAALGRARKGDSR
jgi:hypothetical protein